MSSGGRAGADTPPAFMRLITIKQLLLEVNMLIQNYFENPAVIRIGALPACSYFIPADNEHAARLRREYSGRFHSLNGRWRFGFFENVRALTAPFWEDIGLMDG